MLLMRTLIRTICAAGASIALVPTNFAHAGMNRLEMAIAMCQVEVVSELVKAGADVNGKDGEGRPILRWLASNRKCTDATALATAKLLSEGGANFQSLDRNSGPSLLVNIAHRRMPQTLAFLIRKKGSGDPTQALRAIARSDDLSSVRALLEAGADPLVGKAKGSALFDASAEGQRELVVAMLAHVQEKQSPKVLAAYEIAKRNGNQEIVRAFLDSGMKPADPIQNQPGCRPQELTATQSRLLSRLGLPNNAGLSGLAGAMNCRFIQECGALILVDCNSAADGPAYYINQKTEDLLATCGGACMRGCKGCPPKEWVCECKR